uniref:Protein RIC-3-like n=1 Tax=Seriola lalandi dorsalis TaxID=1841481 RepID=A0A3B4WRH7_SERLL
MKYQRNPFITTSQILSLCYILSAVIYVTAPEGRGQRAASAGFSRAHNTEAIAKAKGVGTGAGTGGKSNLAGQIIPVYGFGILLYILYILFKVKSWIRNTQLMCAVKVLIPQYFADFQLAQLQEKLRETELVMENIVSNAHHSPDRWVLMADQEESLLQQLTEITRVMQEGQLVEGITIAVCVRQEFCFKLHLLPPSESDQCLSMCPMSLKQEMDHVNSVSQEKMEDLTRPVETEPAQSQVRRRNKRRRAKKAAH